MIKIKLIDLLKSHGEVFNLNALLSVIESITNPDLVDAYLNTNRVFYYNSNPSSTRDFSFNESEQSEFKIVKLINTRNFYSYSWCFAFIRETSTEGSKMWKGAYAGGHKDLFKTMKYMTNCRRSNKSNVRKWDSKPKINFPQLMSKHQFMENLNTSDFSKDVFNQLHDKSEWGNENELLLLDTYIRNQISVARSKVLFQKEESELLEVRISPLNSTGKIKYSIYLNTGLLDEYLNFIIIKFDMQLTEGASMNESHYEVIDVERVISTMKENIRKLEPFNLLWSSYCKTFGEHKIDIENHKSLEHVFKDRITRASVKIDLPLSILRQSLEYSVDLAVKLNKIDYGYIVPFYSIKWDNISFLIPLYVPQLGLDNPVCALVVGNSGNNIWSPVTTLRLETAWSNARLLGKVNAKWIRR